MQAERAEERCPGTFRRSIQSSVKVLLPNEWKNHPLLPLAFFRSAHLLEAKELCRQVLATFKAILTTKGRLIESGRVVDATVSCSECDRHGLGCVSGDGGAAVVDTLKCDLRMRSLDAHRGDLSPHSLSLSRMQGSKSGD